ncbi:MAG: hypothetical protein Fues2KO_52830 [Fuerstiella sp.]
MAVLRVDTTHIDDAWFKFKHGTITQREIPELQITYYAGVNDDHDDIIGDANYVKYGDELYVGDPAVATGLYAGDRTLEKIGTDSNVSVWRQTIKVASIQPEKIGQDPLPLNRKVEFIGRRTSTEKINSLIDWNNRPVMNRAGDRLSGFEVEIPTATYRFRANFSSIPDWSKDYHGAVNTEDIELPVVEYATDGTRTVLETFTLRAGTAKLLVDDLPLTPKYENGQRYFPIDWQFNESPVGWSRPELNAGLSELVYTDAAGNTVDTATIIAGTYAEVKKRHIRDDRGEMVREPTLLDWWGRKLQIPSLSGVSHGTVDTRWNEDGYQVRIDTAPITEEWIGLYVKILPTGWDKRFAFFTTITNVLAGIAYTSDPAPFKWTGAEIYSPGISAINYVSVPYADLSVVPVP